MIYDYAFWAVFLQMSIIAPTALGIFPLCAFWTKIQSVFPRKINECKYPGGKRKDLSVRTQIRSFSSSKHKKVRMSINPSENCFEQIKTCCCWIIYILIWITVLQYYCIRSVYIIHYTYVCVCVCVCECSINTVTCVRQLLKHEEMNTSWVHACRWQVCANSPKNSSLQCSNKC